MRALVEPFRHQHFGACAHEGFAAFHLYFDPDKKLANAIAGTNLPITIFVDESGKSYVNRLPLDAAKLSTLVKQWTGMTVTP